MKNKRLFKLVGAICLAAVIAIPLTLSCAAPTPAPAPAPAPTPAPEVITWTMQGGAMAGDPQYLIGVRIAEKITTLSGGRLVVDVFPGGAIVPAGEEHDGVRTGVLDIANVGIMLAHPLYPEAGIMEQVSGGMSQMQLMSWYMAGEGLELLNEALEPFGILSLGVSLLTPEDWAYTTLPLNTLDDVKKLMMRTAGDGGAILDRMGAATVFMPGGECYEAMQRGVINAFEYTSAFDAWEMGFHEVIDYLYTSLTRAPSGTNETIVNKDSWAELTPDLQLLVQTVVDSEISVYYTERLALDAAALEKIADYGVQVQPLPKEIADAFVVEAKAYYDEKIAEEGAGSFYARVMESRRAWKANCELQGLY